MSELKKKGVSSPFARLFTTALRVPETRRNAGIVSIPIGLVKGRIPLRGSPFECQLPGTACGFVRSAHSRTLRTSVPRLTTTRLT